VRDARITMIYEGTNGVQALDLVGRKLPVGTGRYLRAFFHPVDAFITKHKDNAAMKEFIKPLSKHIEYMQHATLWIAMQGFKNADDAAAGSVEYQKMFAHVALTYVWARQAAIALDKVNGDEKEFYQGKLDTARFFMQKILPANLALLASITAGSKSVMQTSF